MFNGILEGNFPLGTTGTGFSTMPDRAAQPEGPAYDEIEVTPKMIEAGLGFAYEHALDRFSTWLVDEEFIEAFARAILSTSRSFSEGDS